MGSEHYKYAGGQGNEDELGTKVLERGWWSLIVESRQSYRECLLVRIECVLIAI